jgi:hypothetical protein
MRNTNTLRHFKNLAEILQSNGLLQGQISHGTIFTFEMEGTPLVPVPSILPALFKTPSLDVY